MKSYIKLFVSIVICCSILSQSHQCQSQSLSRIIKNKKKVAVNNDNWLQMHNRVVMFQNGIKVQLLIVNSIHKNLHITSVSPNEKIITYQYLPPPGNTANIIFIASVTGQMLGMFPLQTTEEIGIFDHWSNSGRYLSGFDNYIDVKTFKSISTAGIKNYREWSNKGDILVNSNDPLFIEAYASQIQNDHFVTRPISPAETSDLLGDAFLPSLKYAKESEIDVAPGVWGRSFYSSTDGKRVLFQNYVHKKPDWAEEASPDDQWSYYIVDKHGLHLQAKYTGVKQPNYIQWLDNRWLLGRTNNPLWRNYEGNGVTSTKGMELDLWDTDTGKHYYAPLPVQYEYDAMRCRLLQANINAKK